MCPWKMCVVSEKAACRLVSRFADKFSFVLGIKSTGRR